ncbi:PREDICTED: DNA/RNA-binding protein KIN17 [Dufourea novaeangliae]|uniref:DNA/RNA-binding protein KIN17 n=1 Tax=Dufourea novaeangliae TaxID=178035 RepID=A0A154PPY6_DUFNO|nr:PREDICTED: DNA/RNA-binding protein KIN17 [Dufourea novaeangliae]KZC13464.1 DNA/RNA-binding protein KIN17 [Dufourea novaeangliae]
MGKHEVGTPKYIANKIKAKGLQKLRWYCQMCQKQCRDENGFKCHTMSESHHRQLLLFADNAHRYMDQFSKEFSHGYLNLLKRQFGTRRVAANRVYQEYISDRGHIHMNATMWVTLTAFVKWLGRTGQCVVDETEKGWYVTYIDRDPETLAAQEKKAKKQKMDKDDEERMMEFIEKQVEKGQQETSEQSGIFKEPLSRSETDAPLVLEMKINKKPKLLPSIIKQEKDKNKDSIKEEYIATTYIKQEELSGEESETSSSSRKRKKHKSKVDADEDNLEGWLREGLTVKIVTKSLGEKYYKAKGIVQSVEKKNFVGKVKLKSPEEVENHIIKIDQEYLETVIPAIGKEVIILWGKYKGKNGVVHKLHIENYCIDVQLDRDGTVVKKLPYEQVCKYVT